MARCAEDIRDGSHFDDPACVDHANTVTHLRYDPKIVSDEQDRKPDVIDQPSQQVEYLRLYRYVERGGRLVGQK